MNKLKDNALVYESRKISDSAELYELVLECPDIAGKVLPGQIVHVACGEGTTLELLEVQYEGAKRMPAADFLRGHPAHVGMRLDEPQENPA